MVNFLRSKRPRRWAMCPYGCIDESYNNRLYHFRRSRRRMKIMIPRATRILMMSAPFFFLGGGESAKSLQLICPAGLMTQFGSFSINSRALPSMSSFSSSCCSSWQPLSQSCSFLQGASLLQTKLQDPWQLTTVSFLPWNTIAGWLNLSKRACTHLRVFRIDLPIFIERKGIMSRSSKMVNMNLLFLVRAVGLTIALPMMSSSSSPIWLITNSFMNEACLSRGNSSRGEVMMQPLTGRVGRVSNSFTMVSPPRLWAQRKTGRSGRAILRHLMTSLAKTYRVAQPLAPPEQPNPVMSMRSTSNWWVAQKWATSLKRPECSPKPWMMQMVRVASRGVYLVWQRRMFQRADSMYCLVMVQCSRSNYPRNWSLLTGNIKNIQTTQQLQLIEQWVIHY